MKKSLALLLVAIFLCGMAFEYHGPETELVHLINNEREAQGVPPLTINWEITRLARNKSEEMKNHGLFCHESLVYGNPAQLLERFSVPHNIVGANIAKGQEAAEAVIRAWQSSPGHLANLLNPDFTKVGVGLSWNEDGIPYWTLLLVA